MRGDGGFPRQRQRSGPGTRGRRIAALLACPLPIRYKPDVLAPLTFCHPTKRRTVGRACPRARGSANGRIVSHCAPAPKRGLKLPGFPLGKLAGPCRPEHSHLASQTARLQSAGRGRFTQGRELDPLLKAPIDASSLGVGRTLGTTGVSPASRCTPAQRRFRRGG